MDLKDELYKCYLMYESTNENLRAITLGLDLKSYDSVLAVCGSGDQGFAMIEYAKEVKLVDVNDQQIAYAKIRAEMIRKGFYKESLSRAESNIKKYFSKRFSKIRRKIDRMTFEVNNFEDLHNYEDYGKIYLSNVSNKGCTDNEKLIRVLFRLSEGALVYSSCDITYMFERTITRRNKFRREEKLIKLARRFERGWSPVIYRRLK